MNTNPNPKLDLIFGRRSIRIFAPGEISEQTITDLLKAAMAAPSAMTKDPWRFVVVRDRHTLSHLAGASPGGKMLVTAAAAIAVCGDIESAFENNMGYLLQDCSAAVENLLLAAHGLGLGACWVGVHPAEASVKKVRNVLALPPRVVPIAVVALGQPGEQLPARTRYNAEFVHFEKWT